MEMARLDQQLPEHTTREAWEETALRAIGARAIEGRPIVGSPVTLTEVEPQIALRGLHQILSQQGLSLITSEAIHMRSTLNRLEQKYRTEGSTSDGATTSLSEDASAEVLANHDIAAFVDRRNQAVLRANDLLTGQWPELRKDMTIGVRLGIRQGYIPSYVQQRLERTLVRTPIRIIDAELLKLYTGEGDVTACYDGRQHTVLVSHRHFTKTALAHELLHPVAGGTFRGNVRTRSGFSEGARLRNVDEAIHHHLTLALLTGNFDVVDPVERDDHDSDYVVQRKLLAAFLRNSRGVIDLRAMTQAYFEEGGFALRREFVRQCVAAYGHGSLKRLEQLMRYADRHRSAQELPEGISERMSPPELDESGAIVRRGSIGASGLDLE